MDKFDITVVDSIDPKSLGRVAVLYGGRSAEREVSLMSGQGVNEALRSLGVDSILFDPSQRELNELKAEGVSRVFIALHGRYGEDGSVQGALELLQIPYTGSGIMASAVCMDKVTTKRLWLSEGLPTPNHVVIDVSEANPEKLSAIGAQLGYPLIFKAPHEGSTLGLARVNHESELAQGFSIAAQLDRTVLAEQFIQGRELTVAVLGEGHTAHVLPIIEIIAPNGNYDFQNKYYTDVTRYECPAQLPDALSEKIKALAKSAYCSIGCSGWGRVDILLDSKNEPTLLEINTSPGMTGHSLVPMAGKQIGLTYAQLCLYILSQASLKL
jgi:D-alanine-D-alanine ligase